MPRTRILIVDDEEHILELLRYNLNKEGYEVITANNGEDGLMESRKIVPDLIILDLMLPGIDGLEVCKSLRYHDSTRAIPIIMLTAKNEEIDKVVGLEIGADDYVTKPFSVRELTARIKALLRRASQNIDDEQKKDIISINDLVIDSTTYEVTKGKEKIDLTLKEFELLKLLAINSGRVLTRDFLLDKVWGYEYIGETRTVDVHIRHLRKKLDDDTSYIETIRGVGYKFNVIGEK